MDRACVPKRTATTTDRRPPANERHPPTSVPACRYLNQEERGPYPDDTDTLHSTLDTRHSTLDTDTEYLNFLHEYVLVVDSITTRSIRLPYGTEQTHLGRRSASMGRARRKKSAAVPADLHRDQSSRLMRAN